MSLAAHCAVTVQKIDDGAINLEGYALAKTTSVKHVFSC
jgi:hypothetical protein